jgi:hypothetical protein
VRVSFYVAPPAPAAWQRVGRVVADWVAPGEAVLGPVLWTPPADRPYALQARLDSAGDPLGDVLDPAATNNVAERRL